ncbi:MAG: hypothetical protein QOE70_2173 [Chthoniobacter sp.]|jgi:hypothetical protein|nr:hypothetical protein [Chthoniobacter sp.]
MAHSKCLTQLTAAAFCLGMLSLGGCNQKTETPPTAAATPSPAPVVAPVQSAEPNSFEEVAAQLDRGGALYLYLSTEAWLAGLSQQIESLRDLALSSMPGSQDPAEREQARRTFGILTDLVRKSGLEEITGLGASSLAVEPGIYRNKLFVHHHAGKGNGFMWSALGKAPHPLAALDLLPAETAMAAFSDLDLAQLIGVVRQQIEASGIPELKQGLEQGLAQFAKLAGMSLDELLQSLGGSSGLVITLDPSRTIKLPIPNVEESIPKPRVALLVQVKDDRIFQLLDKTLAGNATVVRVDEPTLRLRSMPMPVLPGWELRPSVAQWGGYLVLASDEKLIREIIAAHDGGKGFKSTPEYARLSAGLPSEGNSFQLATARYAETRNRLQHLIMKNQPAATAEQAALVEKLLTFQKVGASLGISTHLPNGWLTVGKGTHGAGQLMLPLLIAPAAILAGVAVPVFGEVQERGKATKSLSNAKQIGLGCKLYAQDNNGKFPPSIEALVPDYLPDRSVFISPFAPNEPIGYAYTSGLTEASPPDTVLVEDKFAAQGRVRIVVRVDTSGQVIRQR